MGVFKRLALALVIVLTLLSPTVARAQSTADLIFADLDAWWAAQFAERGIPYSSPTFKVVSSPGTEICGFLDVYESIAGYCAPSRTITISDLFVDPNFTSGVLTLLSHEFGHHVQNLTNTGADSLMAEELQADCFGGAFIAYAQDSDWVSPVVAAMAMQLSQAAGDVWWQVPFDESIHGTQSDRALAFLTGVNGGLAACGL